MLVRRRHGSGRGAATLAVRQAGAAALIAGVIKLDATGRSWQQKRSRPHVVWATLVGPRRSAGDAGAGEGAW